MRARQAKAAEARDTAALLMAVTERTRQGFEDVAARFDLTPAQARAVLALAEAVPMRSLAEHLRCDASNITGLADRLAARGLVARAEQHGDRRVKLLALTETGRELRTALEAAMLQSSPVMTSLDPDEREVLRRLLLKASAGDPRGAGRPASAP